MALMSCRACGQRFSDHLHRCPVCGERTVGGLLTEWIICIFAFMMFCIYILPSWEADLRNQERLDQIFNN